MTKKRLSSNFLPQTLGELELAILGVLWKTPDLSAKEITTGLTKDRQCKLSTVQSSLESLRKKGFLAYHKQRQAFVYSAIVSRSELLAQFVGDIIHTLHDGELDTILSSFVYVAANIHDKALDDLEKLIQDKRKSEILSNKQVEQKNRKEPK